MSILLGEGGYGGGGGGAPGGVSSRIAISPILSRARANGQPFTGAWTIDDTDRWSAFTNGIQYDLSGSTARSLPANELPEGTGGFQAVLVVNDQPRWSHTVFVRAQAQTGPLTYRVPIGDGTANADAEAYVDLIVSPRSVNNILRRQFFLQSTGSQLSGQLPSGDPRIALYYRSLTGEEGPRGPRGIQGVRGWSPELEMVPRGNDIVLRVHDWVGGGGTKPATGQYIGAGGFTSVLADAVNIRGSDGSDANITTAAIQTILDDLGLNTTNIQDLAKGPMAFDTRTRILSLGRIASTALTAVIPAGDATSGLTQSEVDARIYNRVAAMLSGNTESGIDAVYQTDNTIDLALDLNGDGTADTDLGEIIVRAALSNSGRTLTLTKADGNTVVVNVGGGSQPPQTQHAFYLSIGASDTPSASDFKGSAITTSATALPATFTIPGGTLDGTTKIRFWAPNAALPGRIEEGSSGINQIGAFNTSALTIDGAPGTRYILSTNALADSNAQTWSLEA